MNELIYPDTNIYLDYLENRTDKLRPLGEFAFRLLQRTLKCEFKIVVSGWIMKELIKHINIERVEEILNDLKEVEKLINVEVNPEDKQRARDLIKDKTTHFDDALHVVLAQKAGAKILITRNVEHFADFQDMINIQYPESI